MSEGSKLFFSASTDDEGQQSALNGTNYAAKVSYFDLLHCLINRSNNRSIMTLYKKCESKTRNLKAAIRNEVFAHSENLQPFCFKIRTENRCFTARILS